tara:strand:+ start:8565 stop:8669 length:105 start_codon:yes stop_codon:yes gene_type:complete
LQGAVFVVEQSVLALFKLQKKGSSAGPAKRYKKY